MSQLDTMLKIVGALQDTCVDPGGWERCLLQIADLLDSNGVVLALEDRRRGFAVSFEGKTGPESRLAYLSEFHEIDPVIAFGRRAPVGRSYVDAMAIERAALDRSRFHADFSRRFDYTHCIQAFTHQHGGCSGFFVAARALTAGAFDQQERALLDQLIPHFERALRLRTALERADLHHLGSLGALDEIAEGVIVVDDQLTITFANSEAQRLLREKDGLLSLGPKLVAATASEMARLRRCIGQACSGSLDGGPSVFPIGRPPPKRPLFLRVAKLSAAMAERLDGQGSGACVFVGDPDRAWQTAIRSLQEALGLTPAEARVASLLAAGMHPRAIVSELKTSSETVRTHLKHAFAKTNTSRQAELVALINAIPKGRADSRIPVG